MDFGGLGDGFGASGLGPGTEAWGRDRAWGPKPGLGLGLGPGAWPGAWGLGDGFWMDYEADFVDFGGFGDGFLEVALPTANSANGATWWMRAYPYL